jgi:predicted transcriptional regulator
MRPTLLHLLFPRVRAEVLRLLFTNPRQELYVRELARLSFVSLQTVQDELAKLHAAQLVLSRSNGYHRFYRANSRHPLYMTLRRMVIKGVAQSKPIMRKRRIRIGKLH